MAKRKKFCETKKFFTFLFIKISKPLIEKGFTLE
ncbi:hypothetical protein A33I_09130 [Alkalihalophilus marmarensis DSM 21297]|uniref:Uncharacterized protein n=1 Tax=Alkalihalophilus marmarensis DSM 21297 TaxID=1188261 RepID=U6STI2_9BACI|nr:hypothetical protein A33I_09130 [Alkalihalophilus marmarensis DSM 21297]